MIKLIINNEQELLRWYGLLFSEDGNVDREWFEELIGSMTDHNLDVNCQSDGVKIEESCNNGRSITICYPFSDTDLDAVLLAFKKLYEEQKGW